MESKETIRQIAKEEGQKAGQKAGKEAGQKAGERAAKELWREQNNKDFWQSLAENYIITQKIRNIARDEINNTDFDRKIETSVDSKVKSSFYDYITNQSQVKALLDEHSNKLAKMIIDRCTGLESDFNSKFDKAKDNMDKHVKQAAESFALQFTRKDENNLLFRTIENNYKVKFEELTDSLKSKQNDLNINNEIRLQKAETRANTGLILGTLAMVSSVGFIIYNQM